MYWAVQEAGTQDLPTLKLSLEIGSEPFPLVFLAAVQA